MELGHGNPWALSNLDEILVFALMILFILLTNEMSGTAMYWILVKDTLAMPTTV